MIVKQQQEYKDVDARVLIKCKYVGSSKMKNVVF